VLPFRQHGKRAQAGDETIFHEAMELRHEYTSDFTGERQRASGD
jgi:hypothetical protein